MPVRHIRRARNIKKRKKRRKVRNIKSKIRSKKKVRENKVEVLHHQDLQVVRVQALQAVHKNANEVVQRRVALSVNLIAIATENLTSNQNFTKNT